MWDGKGLMYAYNCTHNWTELPYFRMLFRIQLKTYENPPNIFLFISILPTPVQQTQSNDDKYMKSQCLWLLLTHLDLFSLCVLFMARPFALLTWCRCSAGYFTLGHSQVQQQSANLTLELQAARVFEDRHQVQLQILSHAADLRLGQSGRQVC